MADDITALMQLERQMLSEGMAFEDVVALSQGLTTIQPELVNIPAGEQPELLAGVLGVAAAIPGLGEVVGWAATAWAAYEIGSALFEGFDGGTNGSGGGGTNGYYSYTGGGDMANGTGVDLYGHGGVVMNGGAVPVGGIGVPEPPAAMVARQWKTKAFSKTAGEYWVHFFRLVDGRMMCYNAAKRTWKMWRPRKPLAVLYRGRITLSQAVKVQAYLDKMWKNVAKRTKAIKMA